MYSSFIQLGSFLRISHASLATEEYTKEKEVSMSGKCFALPQEHYEVVFDWVGWEANALSCEGHYKLMTFPFEVRY